MIFNGWVIQSPIHVDTILPEPTLFKHHFVLNPAQQLTSVQRLLLCGVRGDLIRGTSKECTLPIIRNLQPTPLAEPSQRLIHTNPRSAACAISTTQDYQPKAWSNSSSGIGKAPKLPGSITAFRKQIWSLTKQILTLIIWLGTKTLRIAKENV